MLGRLYGMEQELNQLKERIYGTIARRRKRRRAVRSAAAAAAVVLSVGIWQWSDKTTGTAIDTPPAPIALVKSTDVELTLSGGRTVPLDGGQAVVENGELTHQGGIAQEITQENTIFVPRGKRFELTLADGTHVWLNTESSLRFPAAFNGVERRVELVGEACFDVAANPRKPFIVQAAGQRVRVLGTLFNVTAYRGEQAVFTLRRGSIELAGGSATTVLKPGQQAVLLNDRYDVSQAAAGATAWVEGEFAFGGQRLDAVMARLARWYDFEYEFSAPEAAAMRLSGEVPMFDDMETIIRLIESSGQVTVRRQNKHLKITAN